MACLPTEKTWLRIDPLSSVLFWVEKNRREDRNIEAPRDVVLLSIHGNVQALV
jgi:hypothetical protein